MNLMEVQSRLNKLPPLPESIQYLTAAAQGGNTQVPPFMALARISEINKEMQSAQNKPQPPAEPLNQSLPKQALQSMGIGALPQGQPAPQGMPQQGAPQGMPQQGAPQGMPQQGAPQQGAPQPVRMAADGGLMSLPVDDSMFEYGSGGVVAFANPEGNQLVKDEAPAEEAVVEDEPGYDAEAELKKLLPQIQKLRCISFCVSWHPTLTIAKLNISLVSLVDLVELDLCGKDVDYINKSASFKQR